MNKILEELQSGGLDAETGIAYTGGEETYMALLQRFCRDYPFVRRNIEEYASHNIAQFTVLVHSIKSSSRMLGAFKLGDGMEDLEKLGKAEDMDGIHQKMPSVLKVYEEFAKALTPIVELPMIYLPGEPKREEALEILQQLMLHLSESDGKGALESVSALKRYPFSARQKEELEKIRKAINNLLYEDALLLVDRLNRYGI